MHTLLPHTLTEINQPIWLPVGFSERVMLLDKLRLLHGVKQSPLYTVYTVYPFYRGGYVPKRTVIGKVCEVELKNYIMKYSIIH